MELKDTHAKAARCTSPRPGKPYPLQITKTGAESGKVIFNRWNQPVTLQAPTNAIDISALQKGG